jgi:mannosyltransferase
LRTNSNEGVGIYRKISEKYDKVFATGCIEPDVDAPRENAVIVVLARNKELEGVVQSLRHIERHFNRWFHYPYVFLNDGVFNETFKDTVRNYTSGKVEFGQIDPSMWGFPDWADMEDAQEGIAKQGDAAIMYGGMASYHHMCRFYSGYEMNDLLVFVVATLLTEFLDSFTSTSFYRSTNGIGA